MADVIGGLGNKLGGEYMTKSTNPELPDIRIGTEADHSTSDPPSYITIYFPSGSRTVRKELTTVCASWRRILNNPDSGLLGYACSIDRSFGVQVRIITDLDRDFNDAEAHVMSITLQRLVFD